jgi:hypothetical protein
MNFWPKISNSKHSPIFFARIINPIIILTAKIQLAHCPAHDPKQNLIPILILTFIYLFPLRREDVSNHALHNKVKQWVSKFLKIPRYNFYKSKFEMSTLSRCLRKRSGSLMCCKLAGILQYFFGTLTKNELCLLRILALVIFNRNLLVLWLCIGGSGTRLILIWPFIILWYMTRSNFSLRTSKESRPSIFRRSL